MRTIEYTTRFRRDYRREQKGRHGRTLDTDLLALVDLLAGDRAPPVEFRDHALTGNWVDHRDCHIRPHLVPIYRTVGRDGLQLVRLGSHSELGL